MGSTSNMKLDSVTKNSSPLTETNWKPRTIRFNVKT